MELLEHIKIRHILSFIIGLILLIALMGSFQVISPGNVGVIFNNLWGSLYSVPQGITFKVPFVTRVESYPIALRTYTMVQNSDEGSSRNNDSLDLPTREGQHIKQDLSVTYNTSERMAVQVFKSFRGADIESIEQTYIRRTIITIAQNVAGTMSLTDIISTKRNELQDKIQKDLSIEFNKMGFIVDKVNLGASHLPPSIEKGMQEKMASQQDAQRALYLLQKAETMAKAEVAKAEGESQALLIKAQAQSKANALLQQSLTPLLLKDKYIEKWNGQLPKVQGNATPIIDMRDTE